MTETKIIDKIRKLLALAEGASTPEEAETAFEKAQALMRQHAIEEIQVGQREGRGIEIVTRKIALKERDEIRKAKLVLVNGIAAANRCQVVHSNSYFMILGTKDDTEFVELLWSSVLIQMATERSRAWKRYAGHESRFRFVTTFAFSYAVRIGERLRKAEEAYAGGAELVLARDAVADKMAELFPNVRTQKVGHRGSVEAMAAGERAANRADLSGGRNNLRSNGTSSLGSLLP